MQITDILAQTGGLQSMARELGVSETEAASGASALVPAILGGFKKQAQSQPAGLEGLGGLLGQLGGGGLLDDVLSPQPTDVEPRQRRTRSDIRLQGREPHGRGKRGFTIGTRLIHAQEDAADAGDAGRRLHGEAAGRRSRGAALVVRRRARRHAGQCVRRPGRRRRQCSDARPCGGTRLDARPERRRQSAGRHPADGWKGNA